MEQSETAGSRFTLKRAGDFRQKLGEWWQQRWVRWLVYALAAALTGWLLILLVFARDLPSVDKLRTYEPPLPTNVRAIDGQPIHSFARERRVQLAYGEYPRLLIHAYLSAEDRTFFSHGGVDYPGIVAALISNLTRDGRPIGASTITQRQEPLADERG
jgi:penicillin-binding protein 1A